MDNKKITVAIYHATLPKGPGKKGGVEASVHRIANSLAARGVVDVTVFSSGDKPDGAEYKHVSVLNVTNSNRISRVFLSPILMNFINLRNYDIIHYFGDDWFHFPSKIKTVRTFQGSAKYEAHSATRFLRRVFMYIVYCLEIFSSKKVGYPVGSDLTTSRLYNCKAIVGNGVDTGVFNKTEKSDDITLSFVGTWGGRKRGEFLFTKFVSDILPVYPNARLQMISDRCDYHPSVDHITNASDEDVAKIIARSWVFAYPSTYEGFGIPYVEAMSCGTVIVSSKNSGAENLLVGGEFGIIADDGKFSSEVIKLLRDKSLRESFESKGMERAKLFSSDQIAIEYENIYQGLVKSIERADV